MRSLLPMIIAIGLATCTSAPDAGQRSGTTPQAADPLNDAWSLTTALAGEWKNALDTADLRSYEHWVLTDSISMTGLGFVLSGADTVFIEDLRITRQPQAITYSARISTQNNGEWVDFTLAPAEGDTLRFTNPQHDFPQEILYARTSAGTWEVLVKGGLPGRERQFELRFEPRHTASGS